MCKPELQLSATAKAHRLSHYVNESVHITIWASQIPKGSIGNKVSLPCRHKNNVQIRLTHGRTWLCQDLSAQLGGVLKCCLHNRCLTGASHHNSSRNNDEHMSENEYSKHQRWWTPHVSRYQPLSCHHCILPLEQLLLIGFSTHERAGPRRLGDFR